MTLNLSECKKSVKFALLSFYGSFGKKFLRKNEDR